LVKQAYERFDFSRALEAVWSLISKADKYIVEKAPWMLARRRPEDQTPTQNLDTTLYVAAETLRIVTALASPVLPQSAPRIWAQLGISTPLESVRFDTLEWGGLQPGAKIGEVSAVFPRIDLKEAVATMRALEERVSAQQAELLGKKATPETSAEPQGSARIGIDDFAKVDLRVGKVLSAEPVKGADKLLHLKVDIGEPEPRTIVAGIAEAYQPNELIGRKVVIVANLQPRKLRGIQSDGMIVAASLEGGKPVLAGFLEDVPIGARLK
jgi:methionyl-tRNA synthetase